MVMHQINVLVTSLLFNKPIDSEYLQEIGYISPKINVRDISGLVDAEEKGNPDATRELDALLADAEVIYGVAPPKNVVDRAPKLKWVQTMLAGVDSILTTKIVKSPIVLTNAKGIYRVPVAEFTIHMMLMFVKRARLCSRLQQQKRWDRYIPELLHNKTVGIVGLGKIGQRVARLAKAFDMRVIAADVKHMTQARYVDTVLPSEALRKLLAESDFVVLALPLTPETQGLIKKAELKSMKPTAYFINVSRGAIVDEEALITALEEGWIAGAGIDAFTTEPLPPDNKLWSLPNVIVSSHIAGLTEDASAITTQLFCRNLDRYLHGKRLLNIVNKKKGF